MKSYNKILISSSAKNTIKESVNLAKELNLGIEISRVPLYKDETLTIKDTIEILQKDLGDFSNRITLHAMFSDINPASGDWLLKKASIQRCIESFEIGKAIKADTILFHTGNKGTKHYGSIESFKNNFVSFWKDFIKEFESEKIIAVIENVHETSPLFCLELAEKINSNFLKLALDCGHVNLYAQDTKAVDWIETYGQYLYHMHIHNNFGTNDDHSNLLNGTLNYKEIFNKLDELNLTPSMVLEMFTEKDIKISVDFLKEEGIL